MSCLTQEQDVVTEASDVVTEASDVVAESNDVKLEEEECDNVSILKFLKYFPDIRRDYGRDWNRGHEPSLFRINNLRTFVIIWSPACSVMSIF